MHHVSRFLILIVALALLVPATMTLSQDVGGDSPPTGSDTPPSTPSWAPDANTWPCFRGDAQHTGYSTSVAPDTATILWSTSVGDVIYSSPAIVSNRVYVGCENGLVYCFDANSGAQQWTRDLGGYVSSSPAVVGSNLYIGASNSDLYCLDTQTGAINWNYNCAAAIEASPAVAQGNIYIACSNMVYSITSSGTLNWQHPITDAVITSSPAYANGFVYIGGGEYYFGGGTTRLYCLNASTGAEEWNYNTGGLISSSPTVVNNRVYFASHDGYVYCLDTSGNLVWSHNAGSSQYFYSSPAVFGNYVVIGTYNDLILCLDATGSGSSTTVYWSKTKSSQMGFGGSAAIADDKVFIGDTDGDFYCLNLTTGADIWSYNMGGYTWYGVSSSPAVASGKVIVGCAANTLYCFGWDTTPPKVASTFPSNSATGVNWGIQVSITFDGDMLGTSLSASTFSLVDGQSQPVSGTISYSATSKTVTFTPDADLAQGVTYTAKLTGDVLGANSIGLDGDADGTAEGTPTDDYSFSFTTKMIYGPTLDPVGALQCIEDVQFDLDLSDMIHDLDTPVNNLVIEESSDYGTVLGHTLRFEYPEGVLQDTVNISVTDGQFWATEFVDVTISPVNDPPTLGTINSYISATEDALTSIEISASDIDGTGGVFSDVLTFLIDVEPTPSSNDVFHVNTYTRSDNTNSNTLGNITILPTNDDVALGPFTINVQVIDDGTPPLSDELLDITVTIINANDPPVLEEMEFLVCKEDSWFNFTLEATDVDLEDELEFAAEISGERDYLPEDFKLDEDTGEVTFLPSNDDVGVWMIEFSVSDIDGDTDSQEVTISVDNVNDPPGVPTIYHAIVDADKITPNVLENLTVSFSTVEVEDIDGDTLTYEWDFDSSNGISVDALGLNVEHTYPAEGDYTVTLTVSDSYPGGKRIVTALITVTDLKQDETDDGADDGGTPTDGGGSGPPTGGGDIISDKESDEGMSMLFIIAIIVVIIIAVVVIVALLYIKSMKAKSGTTATPQYPGPHPQQTPPMSTQYSQTPATDQGWGHEAGAAPTAPTYQDSGSWGQIGTSPPPAAPNYDQGIGGTDSSYQGQGAYGPEPAPELGGPITDPGQILPPEHPPQDGAPPPSNEIQQF